jgi:hypothetical protein
MKPLVSMFAVIGLVISCHVGAATAQVGVRPPGEHRGIVWESAAARQALFLPESALDSMALEELPLSAEKRESLTLLLDVQRHPEKYYPPVVAQRMMGACLEADPVEPRASAGEVYLLDELLARSPIVYLGQVEGVVEGLDLRTGKPAQAAAVRIDRAIVQAGSFRAGKKGEVRNVLFPGGSLTVYGTKLCLEPPKGFYRPQVGDWVVFGGIPSEDDPAYFRQSLVFPVDGEMVQVQPYPALSRAAEPRSISSLFDALAVRTDEK